MGWVGSKENKGGGSKENRGWHEEIHVTWLLQVHLPSVKTQCHQVKDYSDGVAL